MSDKEERIDSIREGMQDAGYLDHEPLPGAENPLTRKMAWWGLAGMFVWLCLTAAGMWYVVWHH